MSIVIGALREERRIGKSLGQLHTYLKEQHLLQSTELIIVAVDGGDRTIEIAEDSSKLFKNFKIIKPGKPAGKGRDIRLGMLAASGPIVVYMDADLATPLHHLKDVTALIRHKTTDIVIGIRNIRKMHKSKSRFAISLLGNIAFSLVAGRYIPDTQCGFKAFSKKAVRTCFTRQTLNGWGFDMELIIIAFSHSLRIAQLPLNDWRDVPDGTFHGGLRNMLGFMQDLVIMLRNRLTGKYN